jgi:hypothetical protein
LYAQADLRVESFGAVSMWLKEKVGQELVCVKMMKSKNSISVIYPFYEPLPEMTRKLFKDSMWQEPFPAYKVHTHQFLKCIL